MDESTPSAVQPNNINIINTKIDTNTNTNDKKSSGRKHNHTQQYSKQDKLSEKTTLAWSMQNEYGKQDELPEETTLKEFRKDFGAPQTKHQFQHQLRSFQADLQHESCDFAKFVGTAQVCIHKSLHFCIIYS